MKPDQALHLLSPRTDNPEFAMTIAIHHVPVAMADQAIAAAKRKLLEFLADAAEPDWPLTFWISVSAALAPPTVTPEAAKGTLSRAVVLHVIGDGANRRLANAARRAGLQKVER
jgi:hypothetical protein